MRVLVMDRPSGLVSSRPIAHLVEVAWYPLVVSRVDERDKPSHQPLAERHGEQLKRRADGLDTSEGRKFGGLPG